MPRSLLDRLAALTDPRDPKGRLYPLVPLLALALVATLAGCTSVAAIAHFGRLRGRRLGHALGFHRGRMPCANTLTNLLAALDPDHLDRIIGEWLADRHPAGWDHIALDGKRLRGSRDGAIPGVHLLAAYAPHAAAVIAQMTVEATTNEHKAAPRLLGIIPSLAGAVVTADAMFTHADVCQEIRARGGDYLLYAKENQPDLKRDIADLFAAAQAGESPQVQAAWDTEVGTATARTKGHGRIETRRITTTTWLNEYLRDWPGVGQVFRLERERTVGGVPTTEVVYGITSLTPGSASAMALLGVGRSHWGIENGLHYVRDETLGEDRCRTRRGHSARVLASLRNVALHLLRQQKAPSVPAAIREIAARPDLAMTMLNFPAQTSE